MAQYTSVVEAIAGPWKGCHVVNGSAFAIGRELRKQAIMVPIEIQYEEGIDRNEHRNNISGARDQSLYCVCGGLADP